MYTVTNVEAVKNKRYSVILESDKKTEEFNVSEDILLEFRLVKEKVLSNSDFKKLVVANDRDIVYQKLLHYALYKMRCTKEITDYLNKKKIPFEEHDYYLTKLRNSRILDDAKYAEIYVRESFEFRRLGPSKIAYDLNNKRISNELYDKFIKEITPIQIEENLSYLFNKKLHSIKNKSRRVATENIKKFLITKGYNFVLVNNFCAKSAHLIIAEISEDDVLKKDCLVAMRKYSDSPHKKKNVISYLVRKGYNYSKIKAELGDKEYEGNE